MNIHFSRHAKRQMKWRDISEQDVKVSILAPEQVVDSISDRKNAFKHIGAKWLKVTFKRDGDSITVITVIDKNK